MRLPPSGNYIVEGRKKDLINRGGEKISAEEIENLILGHPAVQNIACVPMPDPRLGEKLCACVIAKKGRSLSLKELVEFLKYRDIAKCKLPGPLRTRGRPPQTTTYTRWGSDTRRGSDRPGARSSRGRVRSLSPRREKRYVSWGLSAFTSTRSCSTSR